MHLNHQKLTGLTPYIFLFWSAREPHRGSWGDTSNISGKDVMKSFWDTGMPMKAASYKIVSGFMNHVLRREYGTFSLSPIKSETENLHERNVAYIMGKLKDLQSM